MEQKSKKSKPERQRSKVSFAIDRDEIDISTEWVQAVMDRPASAAVAKNATVEGSVGVAENAGAAGGATEAPYTPVALSGTVAPINAVVHGAAVALAPEAEVIAQATEIAAIAAELPAPVALVEMIVPEAPSVAATVGNSATVEQSVPVAESIPVRMAARHEDFAASGFGAGPVVRRPVSTVGKTATVVAKATVVVTYEDQTARQFRPRPIRSVADGLTPGQMTVYHLMYQRGEARDGEGRLYQGGYADLCALTGMSKRGIQNVVAELKAKTCIDVHQQPGYHRSQMTTYRVFSEDTILNTWRERGIRYAIGKGKELVIDPGKPEDGWVSAAS